MVLLPIALALYAATKFRDSAIYVERTDAEEKSDYGEYLRSIYRNNFAYPIDTKKIAALRAGPCVELGVYPRKADVPQSPWTQFKLRMYD